MADLVRLAALLQEKHLIDAQFARRLGDRHRLGTQVSTSRPQYSISRSNIRQ